MGKKKKHSSKTRDKSKGRKAVNLRGDIMQVFRDNPADIYNYKQVSARVNVSDSETRRRVNEYLNELVDLQMLESISNGKFKLHPSQSSTLQGVIDFTKSGAAYVKTDQLKEDIYISENKTGFALHGDTVEVILTGGRRGKLEGKIKSVIKRDAEQFVGIIEISDKHAFVLPSNQRVHVDFYVDKNKLQGAKNGQKVVVKLLDWTDLDKSPFAEVVSVLGDPGDNEVEMHAILVEFGLPFEFPENVLAAAENIDVTISESEISKRKDYRSFPTFTIDPEDAKDFDDALSLRKLNDDTFEVGIHIADVSHYVKPGSIIDKEAVNRATSVYLVDRVVPMLPEVLSNFVCSLRPDEDKLCMSAVFQFDIDGNVKTEWFGKTIIRSNKRFTYNDAQNIIEGGDGDFKDEILQLNAWAKSMRKQRMTDGALEFSGIEVKFNLDENGKPTGVFHKVMKEANFLIEEFMLLANKRVAEHAGKIKKGAEAKPFVYRIHDLPDPLKLITLKDFLARLGYKLKSTKPEKASWALNDLMNQVKDQPEEETVKQMAIRTMSKAVYTTDNIGHYGLAFDFYTHFTSPIRRYPDVLVHRLIDAYNHGKKYSDLDELDKLCKHSSNMEKKAADAERASIKYKQVEFMLNKIGEHFSGNVSGLTRWGMYVELEDTKIEGMIPLNSMDDDVYRYDEKKNQIIGTKYKEIFEFGDKVRIKVNGADLILKQLDFRLI
ncbi:ribonuclease R [Cryomorpha ignava]|uniref:Ribonuclease R n=1 Tax=Cryomorpha ignava TaxID=101383 RepID=A0A7K3WN57_9FLAO|nr:ribonuclease R [Cryomorpha ignava]NEN22135.1 ribonuclease R [Cryomorpha ignava]